MAVAIRSTLVALQQWLSSVAENLRSTTRLCHGMRVLSWHWRKVRDCVEDMGITPLAAAPVKGRSCTAERWRSLRLPPLRLRGRWWRRSSASFESAFCFPFPGVLCTCFMEQALSVVQKQACPTSTRAHHEMHCKVRCGGGTGEREVCKISW